MKLHDRTSADAIAREATLRALYDLAVVASGVRDPAEIARMAVEHAQRLLHVDGAVVFVFDAVTGLLQPLHETASAVSEPPVIPGEGAIGLAFQKGEPVTIDDYRSWDQAIPESARRGIVSVLAVPLVADHPIGAVGVWTYEARRFMAEDAQLLSVFAGQIAPALEAARLTKEAERRAEMFEALHEVAVAAGGVVEPDALAALVVDRARRMLGVGGAGIWWWTQPQAILAHVASDDVRVMQHPTDYRTGEDAVGLAFDKRRVVIIDDYQAWPAASREPRKRGVRSSVAVPLIAGDRPVGAMSIWTYEPRRFKPEDVRVLALFASQVAPTIDAAQLAKESEIKADTFEALHELAVAAGGVLDPRRLAALAVDRARDLFGVESGALVWWDADTAVMRVLADNAPRAKSGGEVPVHQGAVGLAYMRREPVIVNDYEHWERAQPEGIDHGVKSMAAVPLLVGDRAAGGLLLRSRTIDFFDSEHTKLMSLLAAQVAPALESARLVEEREEQARSFRILNEFALKVSGVLRPADLARRAVQHARELMSAENAGLAFWTPAEAKLRVLADTDLRQSASAPAPAPGEGIVGHCFATRQPIVVEDYSKWPQAHGRVLSHGVASAAAVPLLVGDRAVGVLSVRCNLATRFSAGQMQLLTLLAAQLAPALEAARLHADLAGSEQRFRSLYQTIACAVLVQGPTGEVLDANRAAEGMFGMKLARMRARRTDELWDESAEDGTPVPFEQRPAMRALATCKPVRDFYLRVARRDGSVRWLQGDSIPVLDADGQPVSVVTSCIDITDRRKAEAALRESEGRFRAVFDRAAIGVARVSLAGEMMEANPALAEMLGYKQKDMVGMSVARLMHSDDYDEESLRALAEGQGAELQVEARCIRKDRELIWTNAITSLVRDDDGMPSFVIVMVEDITARKAQEEALAHQALHDALTGLPNRSLLQDRLQQAIRLAQRGQTHMALLMMDLDRFKDVNDTFGHHTGDLLLREVANRLRSELRGSDTVARLGGDEFAIVLGAVEGELGATLAARKLLKALEPVFTIEGEKLHVGASLGIALFPDHGDDGDVLMRHADVAMYVAKRAASGYAVYAAEEDTHSPGRLALISDLRLALDGDELELYYQPKVELATCQVTGVEALVRWRRPRQGLMLPDDFIPLAEHTGLIRKLGLWVLDAALAQARAWADEGLDLRMAVNLSMRNLHDPELPDTLEELLRKHQVAAQVLQVEITESTLMADPEHAMTILTRLDHMGVGLSIDDFGTGYSSLSYLRRLPVREIKIDKSFVLDMEEENAAVIVRSTIDLGHNLGLKVVAEGVETARALHLVAESGCDLVQGRLFGAPMRPARLASKLQKSLKVTLPR